MAKLVPASTYHEAAVVLPLTSEDDEDWHCVLANSVDSSPIIGIRRVTGKIQMVNRTGKLYDSTGGTLPGCTSGPIYIYRQIVREVRKCA